MSCFTKDLKPDTVSLPGYSTRITLLLQNLLIFVGASAISDKRRSLRTYHIALHTAVQNLNRGIHYAIHAPHQRALFTQGVWEFAIGREGKHRVSRLFCVVPDIFHGPFLIAACHHTDLPL